MPILWTNQSRGDFFTYKSISIVDVVVTTTLIVVVATTVTLVAVVTTNGVVICVTVGDFMSEYGDPT